MGSLSDSILLESTIDSISREERFRAERFVGLLAEVTSKARAVKPLEMMVQLPNTRLEPAMLTDLDTGMVTNLNIVH